MDMLSSACSGAMPPKKWTLQGRVPQDKVERILEAARPAPTSSGLQPYEIIVVTQRGARTHQTHRPEPGQITDGSHLLVFAARDNYMTERINMMFDLTNTVRGISRTKAAGELPQHAAGYKPPA